MILLVTGRPDNKALEALLVLAAELAVGGYAVGIDEGAMAADAGRGLRYEAARFLTDSEHCAPGMVLCLAGASPDAETLMRFRRIKLGADTRVALVGRFADLQARISAEAGLTYAFGRAPLVIDLALMGPKALSAAMLGVPHVLRRDTSATPQVPTLSVLVSREMVAAPETLPVLSAIHHGRLMRLVIIADDTTHEVIRNSRHTDLVVFRQSDLPAAALASIGDAAADYRDEPPGERLGAVLSAMIVAGKPVIDGSAAHLLLATGAPVLPGPASISGLPAYIEATLLPHFASIAARMTASRWTEEADFGRLEQALELTRPARPAQLDAAPRPAPRTVFLPTNGVGLGHARRSLLVAAAMERGADIAFAAFPSCVPMIQAAGFACLPLVSKVEAHGVPWANDLVNHMRLTRALGPGDTLVFDGGYVFDSIQRAIMEHDIPAVWIRRGLWQAGQVGPGAIEREKVFDRVIVPGEAFDELNDDMSYGAKITRVGPIVDTGAQGADRATLRADLAVRAGRSLGTLVVTMLGAGVAADRTAQTMALCTMLERRADVLHLIVIWPGSRIPVGLSGWKSSRVVQTHQAVALMRAADLVVTASGYNSFHEVLYNRIPAIFVPQMAPIMDDQDTRARAASDRGLAITVASNEFVALEQAVTAMLDGGMGQAVVGRLAALELPAPGTQATAQAISEVTR